MQRFAIPGRLPGYNELMRGHWARRQQTKNDAMTRVQTYAKIYGIRPVDGLVEVSIACFEPNAKRDADNVTSGAAKIVLDALKNMGIIKGDGQKYVRYAPRLVTVDRANPRVEVEIKLCGGDSDGP